MHGPVVLSGAVVGGENAVKLGLPEGEVPEWEVRMLFDGDCPLCMREVNMLRDMDKGLPGPSTDIMLCRYLAKWLINAIPDI